MEIFGEQLTGFSPKICRRVINVLRAADRALGEEKKDRVLPVFCEALFHLLKAQIGNFFRDERDFLDCYKHKGGREEWLHFLAQIDMFLDIVEGQGFTDKMFKIEEAVNPLKDIREAAEETARRG